MVVVESEQQIAFLLRLTQSPNRHQAEQARAELLKWGFNPAEPRTAGGEWTAGGSRGSTSRTQQRAARDRAREERRRRSEENAANTEARSQLRTLDDADQAAADYARLHPGRQKKGGRSPVAEARRRYGIPSNIGRMGGKRGQAGRDLLAATRELASIARRRETLNARISHIRQQLASASISPRAQSMLQARSQRTQQALSNLAREEEKAHAALSDAQKRWSRKSAVPDLIKAGVTDARGRLHLPGGSREGGRYARTAVGDMLGLKDKEHSQEIRFHASHRIGGRNTNPVIATVNEWPWEGGEDDGPLVGVSTSHKYRPGEGSSGHEEATFTPAGARQAADHLRDLVTIGRSGHKAAPKPKPTKHSRTADKLRHLIENEDIDPSEKVGVGDGDELAITYKDLLDLLAPHVPPPSPDDKRLRRKANRFEHPEGTDAADLHMLLDTSGTEPVIHLTARERGGGPWDPFAEPANPDDKYDPVLWSREETSQLGMDEAEELADILDRYAIEVEDLTANAQKDAERAHRETELITGLRAQGHQVAIRTIERNPDGSMARYVLVVDGQKEIQSPVFEDD